MNELVKPMGLVLCAILDAPAEVIESRIPHWIEQLARLPQVEAPLQHHFTKGLYVREIFMPAGSFIISKVHRTESPYVISKGRAEVWTKTDGLQELSAPHYGVTPPGTQRILFIKEDTVWLTFHTMEGAEDVAKLEARLAEPLDSVIDVDAQEVPELLGDTV